MPSHFLSALINSKLIDYVQNISFAPDTIASLNVTNGTERELARLFPHATIRNIHYSDKPTDKKVDLLIADISIISEFDADFLLTKVNQVLNQEGLFVFAIFNPASVEWVQQYAKDIPIENIVDEKEMIAQLKDTHLLHFAIYKETIFELDRPGESIVCDIFFAAHAKHLTLTKHLNYEKVDESDDGESIKQEDDQELEEKKEQPEKLEEEHEAAESEAHEEIELAENEVPEREEPQEEQETEHEIELEVGAEPLEKAELTEELTEKEEPVESESIEVESEPVETKEREPQEELTEKKELEQEKEKPEKEPEETEEAEEKEELEKSEEKEEPEEKEGSEDEPEKEEEPKEEEPKEEEPKEEEPKEKETFESEEEPTEKVEREDEHESHEKNEHEEKVEQEYAEKKEPAVEHTTEELTHTLNEHIEMLNSHAQQLTHMLNSSELILLHTANEFKPTEQHQAVLAAYKNSLDQHRQLLNSFIDKHEKMLEKNPEAAEKLRVIIAQNKQLLNQHEEKIKAIEEVLRPD